MKNYFDLTGKVALITGASSGLGAQFALALASQGANIVICARRLEKLEAIKEKVEALGVKCLAVKLDVTDEAGVKEAVANVKDYFGRIDILCNNAGISVPGDFLSYTTDNWDNVVNTNLKSMFLMSREVGKIMADQNYGKIINTASVGGHSGAKGGIPYYSSKGAVVNFTRALAADLAPYNVTVNCIGPGVYDTEMTHHKLQNDFSKALLAGIPLGRFGQEGELDGIVIYFASDASAYCTGQTIYVDGGMTSIL